MTRPAAPDHADDLEAAWMRHARRGDLAAAWTVSDRVLHSRAGARCWHLPRHLQWVWDGRPLRDGRVLVRCYHGLGDTVQFIRYAPLLRAVAREVIVWAQPALLPLIAGVGGVDRVLPLHDGTPEVEYDADVEIMELPYVFRSTLETIPADVPYLQARPASLARDDRLAVGVVWAAGTWDPRRSLPVEALASLAGVSGVALHVLQRGPALARRPPWLGRDAGADDPGAAARVMRALDLVITVDSLPAHLSGALGVRTWTLLHADADWRWFERREDSPWYPTMRLFRQTRRGDWEGVIARVAEALRQLAASRTRQGQR